MEPLGLQGSPGQVMGRGRNSPSATEGYLGGPNKFLSLFLQFLSLFSSLKFRPIRLASPEL